MPTLYRADTIRALLRTPALLAASVGVAAVASLLGSRESSPWLYAFAGASAAISIGGLGGAVYSILRQISRLQLRIALTGAPAAGKTVFANLLFDQLMGRMSHGVAFTADSATAIAVYQTLRGIGSGDWPARTRDGVVFRYEGHLEFPTAPRTVVDLEIGDSAGEYWIDFTQHASEANPKTSYLEYVISADALVHVMDISQLASRETNLSLRQETQDLLIASQLMRAAGGRPERRRLLLVLSKVDLVAYGPIGPTEAYSTLWPAVSGRRILRLDQYLDLLKPLANGEANETRSLAESLLEIGHFAARLSEIYGTVDLMLTSFRTATGDDVAPPGTSSDDVPRWVLGAARGRGRRTDRG